MNALHHLFALVAAAACLPLAAADPWQFNRQLEPGWLESNEGDPTLAGRFLLGASQRFYRGNFDGSFDTTVRGTVIRHAAENPENITAGAEAIATWLFEQDLPPPPPPAGAAAPAPSPAVKWPSVLLRLHGTVRFESDQAFENTQIVFGPRVSFASVNNTGWWWLIPSLHLGYHRVEVMESEDLRRLGEPERSFYRLDAYASWKWKPFAALTDQPALVPIGLHADLRYHQAYDLPDRAERAGLDDSFYRAFDLSYDLTPRKWKYVREIYVRYAKGRLPAASTDARTFSIGVVIAP